MKFIVDNWILIVLACASGGLLLWPTLKRGGFGGGNGNSVSTSEAVRLINREKGVLIDVSDPAEYAAGHAAGARNVPVAQLEQAKALPSNKTLPMLLLCPNGARANRAVAVLRKAGYEKAVAVAGGTAGWREASLPIEKSLDKAVEKAA